MSTSGTPSGPGRRGAVGAAIAGLVVGAIAAGGAYAYANGVGLATDSPAASSSDRQQVAAAVAALERPQVDPSLGAITTAAVPKAKPRTRVVRRPRIVLVTHRIQLAGTSRSTAADGLASAGDDGLAASGGQSATRTKHEADDRQSGDEQKVEHRSGDRQSGDEQNVEHQNVEQQSGDHQSGDHQGNGGNGDGGGQGGDD
jgi:hypothetical protein